MICMIFLSASLFAYDPKFPPFRIIVVRHGEEPISNPPEPYNEPVYPPATNPIYTWSLAVQGAQRAAYLVTFLLGIPGIQDPLFAYMIRNPDTPLDPPLHPIGSVISMSTEKDLGTFRPIQTAIPLGNTIFPSAAPKDVTSPEPNSVLQLDGPEEQPDQDYSAIFTAIDIPQNNNNTIVFAWESKRIPYLIIALADYIGLSPTGLFATTDWKNVFVSSDPAPYDLNTHWLWKDSPKPYHCVFVLTVDGAGAAFKACPYSLPCQPFTFPVK